MAKRGIFCIEGEWQDDLKKVTTVQPLLNLLSQDFVRGIPFVHRCVGNRSGLEYYLNYWTKASYKNYPILYLAFHGSPGCLWVEDTECGKGKLRLEEIAEILDGKCEGRIIHFGSCNTCNIDAKNLKDFLKVTNALAVSGYQKSIYFYESAAFELLLFYYLVEYSMSIRGIQAVDRQIHKKYRSLAQLLQFQMVYNG